MQWFISDLHLGHKNILKYRQQFDTIEQHDNYIVDSILNVVNQNHTLWILGDVILASSSMDCLQKISNNVGCLKIVLGNHDGERSYAPSIVELSAVARLYPYSITGKHDEYLLSHIPVDQQMLYYGQKWNIHGHCHDKLEPTKYHINVTCESLNYNPVSMESINSITQERSKQ